MKLLTAQQIRDWDKFTIENEPILSIDLMERAALVFTYEFVKHFPPEAYMDVFVFCGPGNNGGDGLAVARLLQERQYKVSVFLLCEDENKLSADCKTNLERLQNINGFDVQIIRAKNEFPVIPRNAIVIDAIFGTGINRAPEAFFAEAIYGINQSGAKVVSIDVPSGLFTDSENDENDAVMKADITFTFQIPKLSFLLCQNTKFVGDWKVLDIGLKQDFLENIETDNYLTEAFSAKSIYKKREKCAHKGIFGHALIWAGSCGKIGAALLATKAALRGGAGLVTSYIPKCGYNILQTSAPEAMCLTDDYENILSGIPNLDNFNAIGIGPGIGKATETRFALKELIAEAKQPIVLDADALNILAEEKWLHHLSENCILTPHPKEFERLAGECKNDFERLEKATNFAKENKCILVLKSAYTSIHSPEGKTYFNTTGNPGMATGGSGDVLTGIITSLLAQKYDALQAAILGVYLHGSAGDIASEYMSEEALVAGDIIDFLGDAYMELANNSKKNTL